MHPQIKTLPTKKLIGKRIKMSFTNNKTAELWGSFLPKCKEIENKIGTDLYSIQNFDNDFFQNFSHEKEFEKWACVEVSNFDKIPSKMDSFILKSGLYAVFQYKGSSSDNSIFQYIFTQWLPNSDYELDNRPHFEILGEKYKNNSADSEEEIWIPVKNR